MVFGSFIRVPLANWGADRGIRYERGVGESMGGGFVKK